MTTAVTESGRLVPATVGAWLLDASPDLDAGVARAATLSATPSQGPTRTWAVLPEGLRALVVDAIVEHLRAAYPDGLGSVLSKAVTTHERVRDAARSTLLDPGASGDVGVGHYTYRATHLVVVEAAAAYVGLKLPLELSVEFALVDAHAHLERGRLVRLSLSDPVMRGRVTAYTQVVFTQEGKLHAGGSIVLDPPLDVLTEQEVAALVGPGPT